MTIILKPEQERIIRAEIESGHFRSPDEVLDHALTALQEKTRNLKGGNATEQSDANPHGISAGWCRVEPERQKDSSRVIEL